jgi:hypothetical protein
MLRNDDIFLRHFYRGTVKNTGCVRWCSNLGYDSNAWCCHPEQNHYRRSGQRFSAWHRWDFYATANPTECESNFWIFAFVYCKVGMHRILLLSDIRPNFLLNIQMSSKMNLTNTSDVLNLFLKVFFSRSQTVSIFFYLQQYNFQEDIFGNFMNW